MSIAARHIRPVDAEGTSLGASVRAIACGVGVDVVGYGSLEEAVPPGFAHLPVGISLGVAHPAVRRLREHLERGADDQELFELADHRDHEGQLVLERALGEIAAYLRRQGYRYFSCPPESDPMETPFSSAMVRCFSHKAAATCAGLGWVGRHGLLNHPEYGPHVLWATLLTNAPLVTGEPNVESACGDCRKCVAACPSGAISGRPWRRDDGMVSLVDVERCRAMLEQNLSTSGRRVCGRCAVVCTKTHLGAPG